MLDEFYGLTGKPFQLTPDAEFYFRSITHRKALSYLGYGLAQGEGFIVVTGEVGSGKSILAAHMMANIDPAQMSVAQIVTGKLDAQEVVHVVAYSFGLDIAGHDRAAALGALEAFLHEEARAGRRCMLVIDEAQDLSIPALEELRMLSNFQLGKHPLLQTLLLGQPEFRATLQSHQGLEQLRQRIIAAHHLEPMQQGEIEPYVRHRLEVVGWTGNPAFDPQVFAGLYEASGGNPRRVNMIANRLMLLGAVEQCSAIDPAMLKAVLDEMSGESKVPGASHERQPGLNLAEVEKMLAERDAQIAELQQAVAELASQQGEVAARDAAPEIAALQEQLSRLEARSLEQERSLRQTLAKLIEWIEGELEQSRAA